VFLRHLMFDKDLTERTGPTRQLSSTSSLLDATEHHRSDWGLGTGDHDRLPAARHKGGYSQHHLKDQQKAAPYRTNQPTGLMLVHDPHTVWGVLRENRRRTAGQYSLFKKVLDPSAGDKPWKVALPVRPRAMLKSGNLLFLGGMPTDIPADDPHAAYDGRLGGSLRVCSERDGSTLAEYALSAPVNWDGMAAAGRRLYLSTADGRLICMAPANP
jgi:hypothetical protein